MDWNVECIGRRFTRAIRVTSCDAWDPECSNEFESDRFRRRFTKAHSCRTVPARALGREILRPDRAITLDRPARLPGKCRSIASTGVRDAVLPPFRSSRCGWHGAALAPPLSEQGRRSHGRSGDGCRSPLHARGPRPCTLGGSLDTARRSHRDRLSGVREWARPPARHDAHRAHACRGGRRVVVLLHVLHHLPRTLSDPARPLRGDGDVAAREAWRGPLRGARPQPLLSEGPEDRPLHPRAHQPRDRRAGTGRRLRHRRRRRVRVHAARSAAAGQERSAAPAAR